VTQTLYFFNRRATLYGRQRGSRKSFKLPSGTFVWPFEFTLPSNLPPSYRSRSGQRGKILYGVRAYIDIPWKTDKQIKSPFFVSVLYDRIPLMQQVDTTVKKKVKKKSLFLFFFSDSQPRNQAISGWSSRLSRDNR